MRRAVFTFHDVVPLDRRGESGFRGAGPDHYKLTPERFCRHLDAIGDAAGVVLSFDDGGASALSTIAPLLEQRGLAGSFFVPTAHLGRPGFLRPEEARELVARGHAVGAHGHTHRPLPPLDDAELAAEWTTSREILEELLDAPVTTASVPRGFVDERVAAAAARAGFTDLFTSEPWTTPRPLAGVVAHGRFAVHDGTEPRRVAALARLSRAALAREVAFWEAKKLAKRVGGPAYERVRVARLDR